MQMLNMQLMTILLNDKRSNLYALIMVEILWNVNDFETLFNKSVVSGAA